MSNLSDALEAMDKATPGPWVVQTTNPSETQRNLGPHHVIIADHGNSQTLPPSPVICSLVPYGFGVEGGPVEEQTANARLIAAAPDAPAWIKEALPVMVLASAKIKAFNDRNDEDALAIDALIARAKPEEVGR